ncbi:MAG TPA: transporter substrate-binding domain-containing protein [Candidatus Saccharimonadales bacterium]|nr:transporter substrate-binding domain-containing protein [Candidatus Saccharimonadales bacterium]
MKILKIVVILFSFLIGFYAIKLANQSFSKTKDESILVVGTSPDYSPYEYIDVKTKNIVGFDIDLIEEVARRIGKKIIIIGMPFSSLIVSLFSGSIDVIASAISPTSRRKHAVLFSESYLTGDPLVIVSKVSRGIFHNVKDLRDKQVVVNTGYVADTYMTNQEGMSSKNLVRLESPAKALMALKSGSVDAWICAESSAKAFLEKITDKNQFILTPLVGTDDNYGLVVHKKNNKLVDQINQAIDSMHKDGTLTRLKEKWKLS